MATAARHKDISARFLEHAEAELMNGDLLQASEKTWGALVHHLKSVAQEHDWRHRSHRSTSDNAEELIRLTSDPQRSRERFGLAASLHTNFYEDMYEEEMVKSGISAVRALIDDMRAAEEYLPKDPIRARKAQPGDSKNRRPRLLR